MRLSIRVKLATVLAVIALAPLAVSLVGVEVGFGRVRMQSAATTVQASASAEARAMEVRLSEIAERLLVLRQPYILDEIQNRTALDPDAVRKLDQEWSHLDPRKEPLRSILDNPISKDLQTVLASDEHMLQLFLTDRFGQVVAATSRTDDFYQADEEWWRQSARGSGYVYIPPVEYDPSVKAWIISICVPMSRDGNVLGVAKAKIDITRYIRQVRAMASGTPAEAMLIGHDGWILYRGSLQPLSQRAEDWSGPITRDISGWRITPSGELQGFAQIKVAETIGTFPVTMPRWVLAFCVPESTILSPVRKIVVISALLGTVVILAIFLTGLFLADRTIARRVRKLVEASRRVADGDFSSRVQVKHTRLPGRDEIDDLADDFNRMVQRVQDSQEQLTAANELKTRFIQIAGHELRTPISYILGMGKLLRDTFDPERLRMAVQSMSSKARRLERIVLAMFKLMPENAETRELEYQPLDMRELIEEVHMDCLPFAEKRNQRIVVEGGADVPGIMGDRDKLTDLFENLLMNAVKFTPDGGTISMSISRYSADSVAVAVRDQGSGIASEELPHIFEPFFSGGDVLKHSSGEYEYQKGGAGLGLTVVRRYADLHRATITVDTGSSGTTFTVILPIFPPPESGSGYVI